MNVVWKAFANWWKKAGMQSQRPRVLLQSIFATAKRRKPIRKTCGLLRSIPSVAGAG